LSLICKTKALTQTTESNFHNTQEEIYAILMKQSKNNPTPTSEVRVWELMCACALVFPPPGAIVDYVRAHAFHNRLQPTPIGGLALRTYVRLQPQNIDNPPIR
jgi:hypothetical protein